MIRRLLPVLGATVAILATQDAVTAGNIHRWTGADGQLHFSDTAPSDNGTVTRRSFTRRNTDAGSHGLRQAERRLLERVTREARQKHRKRKLSSRKAEQRRAEQQQECRDMRTQLRETRERTLRKQIAGELRKHCW